MKKTLLIAALLVGLLLFAGEFSPRASITDLGRKAPALELHDADSIVALDRLRGDYVLLNFWSATDAPSRHAANQYTAWQRMHQGSDLKLIGINFDDSEALFHEIVRRDSLENSNQFYAQGDVARDIIDNYGLEHGLGSVLIGPDGKIIAHNPTLALLDQLCLQ